MPLLASSCNVTVSECESTIQNGQICNVFYHRKCLYKVNVGTFSNVFVSVNKRFGSHLCWTGNFPWWEIKYHPHVHFTLFTLQLQNSCLWSLHRDFGVPYHKNIQPTGNWNVKENGFKINSQAVLGNPSYEQCYFLAFFSTLQERQTILTNATLWKDSDFGFIMVVYEKFFYHFVVLGRN